MSPEPEPHAHPHWQTPEARFRLLVESVKDYALIMLDPNGYIVSWNAGAEYIKGYTPAEIIGSHFSRFYPPEDVAARKPERELEQAEAEGRVEDEDWRVRKDGTRFWANVVITALRDPVTRELVGYGKVTRDLTERKAAEERLRQSEEQFRLLVEGVEEYAIFMLDPNGIVATWNVGAEQAKGYTAKEIIGQSFTRFYTAEEQAGGKPGRLLALARETGHARDQGVRVRKDGTTFQADVLITAIHDEKGTLRGYTKLTRDITDQVRTREAEAARSAAEKASQAKDEFLAVLSHELRTPLTPVLAAASFVMNNAATLSREEILEEIGTIRRNVMLEAQLIDDLLDLTRISRGKIELRFEAVEVHAAVQQAIEICREDITAKGLVISTQLAAPDHWVWADPTRIRQVFWNLLTNAVKFTPEGGRIVVRTAGGPAGRLLVEVADTGHGIEPELASRIFNAFEQGERSVTRQFGGLGLGLAITRALVTMHHGSIAVQSEGKGKGAVFQIELPVVAPAPEQAARAATAANVTASSLRLLLVDDHADTRRVLARLLARLGHRVETAADVASALALVRSVQFDVMISDIGLPDGSGTDLMREAKRVQPRLRGIALSGFGMEEDTRRSAEAGFEAHLNKPMDFAVLQEVLSGK
ncbi:MAG TPA: PAS domain S-box protein [Chthoniobacteraceae bacterium]|jgi:PAS domain S-box-containing protein|nr:PAS domain S-box protein [Chthoniobacteraceae bacterium]